MAVQNMAIPIFTATAGAQLNMLLQQCGCTHLTNNCSTTGSLPHRGDSTAGPQHELEKNYQHTLLPDICNAGISLIEERKTA